jgi:small subunit ribosomal protein S19
MSFNILFLIFKYRGKTIDEMKAMSFEEFTTLLPSDLRRKVKRGFTEQENKLLKKLRNKEKNIKTHCRDMFVIPEMVGEKIGIYTGKEFVTVTILDSMIGIRLGELAPSRKMVSHSGTGAKKTDVRK